MLNSDVIHISYHMLRIWIINDEVRAEVRKFFADYLLDFDLNHNDEMEINFDSFVEALDNASYERLSGLSLTTIGLILNKLENDHRDLAGVIFVKKASDMEHPDE